MPPNIRRWDAFYRRQDPERLPWVRQPAFASTAAFLQRLPLAQLQEAVDLGCGLGQQTAALQRETGLHWLGIDAAPRAIEWAQARYGVEAARLRFQVGDVRALPLDDASVDLAWDRGCLHALAPSDRPLYLDEVARILRPGGYLIVAAMGADPRAPTRGLAGRTLIRGVMPLGAGDIERWTAAAFEPIERAHERIFTPLSQRWLPIPVPVLFQCHLLRRHGRRATGGRRL